MASNALKANIIIHSCAITSAVAAGAWASIPIIGPFGIIVGLDTLFLTPLTIGMVIYIGKLFGHSYKYSSLMASVGQIIGMVLGIQIARGLLSLVPILGTGINATVAFGLQETIGWGAFLLLDKGGDIKDLMEFIKGNKNVIKNKVKEEKKNAEKIKQKINTLPPADKLRYDSLTDQINKLIKKLSDKNITDNEKDSIQELIIKLQGEINNLLE